MALDKFQPYLFVSAGEQSNKFLTPAYADGIAELQAQRVQQLTKLLVQIDPVQSGSGDPSPDNIRPISGRTGLTVTRAGKNLANFVDGYGVAVSGDVTPSTPRTATIDPIIINENIRYRYSVSVPVACIYAVWNGDTLVRRISGISPSSLLNTSGGDRFYICAYGGPGMVVTKDAYHPMVTVESADYATYEPFYGTTIPITWQTEAGTVYGGTLDVVSGVLTVTDAQIASYAGETLPGEWISDRDVYAAGTTPTTGAQVVYKLATPQTYQLSPTDVKTLAGFNQVYSDAGPVIDIKF